ncbi:MAG TPA: PilN domain-containing protein, partial [Terriglobales bacterium]|nr:PilN domain-containing protein [Terriglobales bacterium]
SGGVNMKVVVLAIVAAAVIGNYGYYTYLTRESQKLQADLEVAKTENAKLAVVKAKYQEREKVFQLYDRRVKVIHQLQEAQSGPSDLLNTVAGTVNNTDAVWLSTMNDDGKNINLVGTAISANAVANLISNLNKTNYFKSVEIKETYQDEGIKDLQAFSFSLVCEKKTKS